jgi:hypothetical protein
MSDTLGRRLAQAIADKDEARLRELLADDVDFKGLTPGRVWEGRGPAEVVDTVLGHWFEPADRIVTVDDVADGETVSDTARVSYRFDVENPDGTYVVEQQAYYRGDGRIQHLRVLCSGFRPR